MARGVGQRVGIEAGVVGQRMVFEIAPGVFDGIEFRGIRRQHDRVDGAGVGHEPLDEPGTMGLEPIPDEDHRVGRVEALAKLAQERDDNCRRGNLSMFQLVTADLAHC